MVQDACGVDTASAAVPSGAALQIEFADGKVDVQANGASVRPRPAAKKRDDGGNQGSLL